MWCALCVAAAVAAVAADPAAPESGSVVSAFVATAHSLGSLRAGHAAPSSASGSLV